MNKILLNGIFCCEIKSPMHHNDWNAEMKRRHSNALDNNLIILNAYSLRQKLVMFNLSKLSQCTVLVN